MSALGGSLFRHNLFFYTPNTSYTTVKTASVTMIQTIPVTTAEVAASPTAAALRPLCMPRKQPAKATTAPNTAALINPNAKVVRVKRLLCFVEVLHYAEV